MADTISAYAYNDKDVSWPLVWLPMFEKYAANVLDTMKSEVILVAPRIKKDEVAAWEVWFGENHARFMNENLEISNTKENDKKDLSAEEYVPYIYEFGHEGPITDNGDAEYWPLMFGSPGIAVSAASLNWNTKQFYGRELDAALALNNETIISYPAITDAGNGDAWRRYHDSLHSVLPNSEASHPHNVFMRPVHEDPLDDNSEIVAMIFSLFSWDNSLRNLLPESVKGLIAVIRSEGCNLTHSYVIDGKDAFFLGEGDLHEAKYDDKEVMVDLSFHKNPMSAFTPDHCVYKIVSYYSNHVVEAPSENLSNAFYIHQLSAAHFPRARI